jgi:16S rRNA (guanine966-N2)-methyltransferase
MNARAAAVSARDHVLPVPAPAPADPARNAPARKDRRATAAGEIGSMRIVGGRFRGHALKGPSSDAIRPTSDRLRETIFNILAHGYGDAVAGARVLDLFAGTGAMGLEALSRGAAFALFIDDSAAARGLIRENVEALGLGGQSRLFRRAATRLGPASANEPFSLVFCDPPYGKGLAERALASCAAGGWLTENALVVVEEAQGIDVTLPAGFSEIERREYGETKLVLAGFQAEAGSGA